MNRWILHVDMNCYFASVEQQENPALRGKPVGVGGKPGTRSIIASASREAKARGVKTAMAAHEAIAICPDLIIVQPDYPKYQRTSERMFGILESFSPDLEIFSIDEAFLDVTQSRIFPRISTDPWVSVNESVMVSPFVDLVHTIKDRFRQKLGSVLTASIGLAHSKRLAKLASESKKPDGFTVLLGNDEVATVEQFRRLMIRAFTRAELFASSDVEDLSGIGPRLGRRLRAAGIHTLNDLTTLSFDQLQRLVFPYHKELYLLAQGKDASPVIPYWRAKPEQSIGHQYTLPKDVPAIELPATLAWLAERVGRRLRSGGFVAHELSLYLRQTGAPGWGSHQRTTKQLESDWDIYALAWQLIGAAADNPGSGLTWQTPIRMPSLTVGQLVKRDHASTSLVPNDHARLTLTQALDTIRDRFGDRSITSGLSIDVHHHFVPDGRRKRLTPTQYLGASI